MRKNLIRVVAAAAGFASLATSMVAHAESNITTGTTTPLTALAHLDFQVTVPKVLFLQVGAGTALAANATVNQIAFTVPAASVGSNTPVAATVGSGDLGSGTVTARVIGNNGNVTLTATTTGALSNGVVGDPTLSFTQISTTAAQNTSTVPLPAPALGDNTTTTTTVNATGKVVNQDARWTFSFLNTVVVPPGTYGGANGANNSRVTYTASMP